MVSSLLHSTFLIFSSLLFPFRAREIGGGRWEARWDSVVSPRQLPVPSTGSQWVLGCPAAGGGPHVEHHTSGAAKDVILEIISYFFKSH